MKEWSLKLVVLGISHVTMLHAGGASAQPSSEAYELLRDLRELPAAIESFCCGISAVDEPPRIPPNKLKRDEVYSRLLDLDQVAVSALALGLSDSDARIRRQAALALAVLGGGYYFEGGVKQPALEISAAVEELQVALGDADSRVRELSAQAIGKIGASAAVAVPQLIALLKSDAEGDRNSAAIGLRGIGPAARDSLPALQDALSDSSDDVRHFARMAIESISSP